MNKPKVEPMTQEETLSEWQSLLLGIKRITEQPPPEPIIYRCPLCSVETGKYIDDWINHLAQKHTSLELAQYIADEDYRHDD